MTGKSTLNVGGRDHNMANPIQGNDPNGRHIWCRHYDVCLDHAAKEDWEGFSCDTCWAYEPLQLDPVELQTDADHCAALVLAIFHERLTSKHSRFLVRRFREDRDKHPGGVRFWNGGSYRAA